MTQEWSRIFLKVISVLENLSEVQFWTSKLIFEFSNSMFGPQNLIFEWSKSIFWTSMPIFDSPTA